MDVYNLAKANHELYLEQISNFKAIIILHSSSVVLFYLINIFFIFSNLIIYFLLFYLLTMAYSYLKKIEKSFQHLEFYHQILYDHYQKDYYADQLYVLDNFIFSGKLDLENAEFKYSSSSEKKLYQKYLQIVEGWNNEKMEENEKEEKKKIITENYFNDLRELYYGKMFSLMNSYKVREECGFSQIGS